MTYQAVACSHPKTVEVYHKSTGKFSVVAQDAVAFHEIQNFKVFL
jgi:hypothetical protein